MSFRLVPKSVTLNDLERRNGVILRYFSEFGYLPYLPGILRKSSRLLSHLLMSSCFRVIVMVSRVRVSVSVMIRVGVKMPILEYGIGQMPIPQPTVRTGQVAYTSILSIFPILSILEMCIK